MDAIDDLEQPEREAWDRAKLALAAAVRDGLSLDQQGAYRLLFLDPEPDTITLDAAVTGTGIAMAIGRTVFIDAMDDDGDRALLEPGDVSELLKGLAERLEDGVLPHDGGSDEGGAAFATVDPTVLLIPEQLVMRAFATLDPVHKAGIVAMLDAQAVELQGLVDANDTRGWYARLEEIRRMLRGLLS